MATGNLLDKLILGSNTVTPNAATKVVTGAAITAGQAVMSTNGQVTKAISSALALGLYPAGVAVSNGTPGGTATVITQGPVDPNVVNLGAGVACAVGLDTSGNPVRVTAAGCASGLKYLGVCDADGTIYVNPWSDHKLDVDAYGVTADGTTDNRANLIIALARANSIGCSALFRAAAAAYKCVGSLTLDDYTRIEGERLADGSAGATLLFAGADAGFVVGGTAGAEIEISRLTITGDATSDHLFSHPASQPLANSWRLTNLTFNIGNKNKAALAFGTSADGGGIQNSWSKFEKITINSAPQQAVPVVQCYGVSGGLNNCEFGNVTITGGGLASGSDKSTSVMVVVQSTDANVISNIAFKQCGFEIPYAGAVTWLGVRACAMHNCWAGDLSGTAISAPLIFMGQSPNTGGLTSKYLSIESLYTDCGENATGQATVQLEAAGGQYGLVIINSIIPSIESVGNPITLVNSEVLHTVSTSDESWCGLDTVGGVVANLLYTRESTILLQTGLNSDVGTQDFYSSLIRVSNSSSGVPQLGGLAMGAFGDGVRATVFYKNTNNQKLTIVNADASSAAGNRILTLTGANVDVGASDGSTWWAIVNLVWEKNAGCFVLESARP